MPLTDAGTPTPDVPVLHLRSLSKTFPGTRALAGVDLDVRQGEVHALVGQNGSGKSTVIKILAGFHDADPGSAAWLDGEELALAGAGSRRHDRLRFVHQDLGLILELSATENLALRAGFAGGFGGRVDWREQDRLTRDALSRFDADIDVRAPLTEASPIQRTIVAIATALVGWEGGRGLLVLDEPTAVLPHTEVERLLAIVREVRATGTSVLYVSHRLDEIFEIADRVTVLRDGRRIDTRQVADLTKQTLAELMVGEQVDAQYRAAVPAAGEPAVVLRARDVHGRYLRGISLEVRAGEVVGLAGLPGSGAEELPYALAGARAGGRGEIQFPGRSTRWHAISGSSRPQLPIVPADRARDGIIAEFSVQENMSISVLRSLSRRRRLSRLRERELAATWSRRVQVKAASPDAAIGSLSGGNQQKVVVARCLATDPEVLVLCEPTAGVDVGTRQALYELVAEQARQGLGVVVSSADSGDLIGLCHRVLVLHRGQVVAELSAEQITEHALLRTMEGDQAS